MGNIPISNVLVFNDIQSSRIQGDLDIIQETNNLGT